MMMFERSSLLSVESDEKSNIGTSASSYMSYESDSYLTSVMENGLPATTTITTSNDENGGEVIKKKKKKKKRLLSSLSCSTFKDIYSLTSNVLGEGSYGKVVTCVNNFTETEYAVKIISKSSWYYTRQKVLKEVELYYLCQGQPEIIQLIEYFEEEDAFYLIFEKAYGGPLLDQIQSSSGLKKLTNYEIKSIIKDLSTALAFLHERGIAHRDIKPENILCLNSNGPLPVKLCDFDLCSAVYNTITTPRLRSPVGSPEYMAPEVAEAFIGRDFYYEQDDDDGLSYDKRCDLWSLGVLLYILLVGSMPFYAGICNDPDCDWNSGGECASCQHRLFTSIRYGQVRYPSSINPSAKDLISKLLVKDPSQRLDAVDVLSHPWILNIDDDKVTTTTTTFENEGFTTTMTQQNSNNVNKNAEFGNKRTFSQNPCFQRRHKEMMKRQTSMIFPEEFDCYKCQL